MKAIINYLKLVKYYYYEKNCDFFECLTLATDKELYLFNLDLFEKNILK